MRKHKFTPQPQSRLDNNASKGHVTPDQPSGIDLNTAYLTLFSAFLRVYFDTPEQRLPNAGNDAEQENEQ